MTPDPDRVARRFFTVVLVSTIVLLALVVRPLATALFMAAVLAGSLWPLQERMERHLRRRSIVAAILVLGVIVLLLGPLVAFSTYLFREIAEALKFITDTIRSEGVTGLRERLPEGVDRVLNSVLEWISRQSGGSLDSSVVQRQVTAQGGKAVVAVGAAVSATGSLLFQGTMMIIALYFFLVEGDELVSWLDGISPLRRGQTRELLREFKGVTYAVIVSTGITAAVQAAAALIGYYIARVPNPIFFGGLTFFVAFIPAVGAASICLVAAGLLFVTGHPYWALFLAIWGVAVVGLVDNVVKPYLIKAGMQLRGGWCSSPSSVAWAPSGRWGSSSARWWWRPSWRCCASTNGISSRAAGRRRTGTTPRTIPCTSARRDGLRARPHAGLGSWPGVCDTARHGRFDRSPAGHRGDEEGERRRAGVRPGARAADRRRALPPHDAAAVGRDAGRPAGRFAVGGGARDAHRDWLGRDHLPHDGDRRGGPGNDISGPRAPGRCQFRH